MTPNQPSLTQQMASITKESTEKAANAVKAITAVGATTLKEAWAKGYGTRKCNSCDVQPHCDNDLQWQCAWFNICIQGALHEGMFDTVEKVVDLSEADKQAVLDKLSIEASSFFHRSNEDGGSTWISGGNISHILDK